MGARGNGAVFRQAAADVLNNENIVNSLHMVHLSVVVECTPALFTVPGLDISLLAAGVLLPKSGTLDVINSRGRFAGLFRSTLPLDHRLGPLLCIIFLIKNSSKIGVESSDSSDASMDSQTTVRNYVFSPIPQLCRAEVSGSLKCND